MADKMCLMFGVGKVPGVRGGATKVFLGRGKWKNVVVCGSWQSRMVQIKTWFSRYKST